MAYIAQDPTVSKGTLQIELIAFPPRGVQSLLSACTALRAVIESGGCATELQRALAEQLQDGRRTNAQRAKKQVGNGRESVASIMFCSVSL